MTRVAEDVFRVSFDIGVHTALLTVRGLSQSGRDRLCRQISAYIEPHADELGDRLERSLGDRLHGPIRLELTVGVEPELDWHQRTELDVDSARHTIERILVQIVQGELGARSSARDAHAIACNVLRTTIDPTFVCVLSREEA